MAEQRLIDANTFAEAWNQDSQIGKTMRAVIAEQPTIDPETIPLARQLREELAKVTAERDAAVEQLRGYCFACKHYTPYHNDGLCATCKHERACFKPWDAVDRWQWRGPQKKG